MALRPVDIFYPWLDAKNKAARRALRADRGGHKGKIGSHKTKARNSAFTMKKTTKAHIARMIYFRSVHFSNLKPPDWCIISEKKEEEFLLCCVDSSD